MHNSANFVIWGGPFKRTILSTSNYLVIAIGYGTKHFLPYFIKEYFAGMLQQKINIYLFSVNCRGPL